MPRPPERDDVHALIPYAHGDVAPNRLVWDTRIAQRNTPLAIRLQLEGWEPWQADAMPRPGGFGEPPKVLDQILHFRKQVPSDAILARAREWVARLEAEPESDEP